MKLIVPKNLKLTNILILVTVIPLQLISCPLIIKETDFPLRRFVPFSALYFFFFLNNSMRHSPGFKSVSWRYSVSQYLQEISDSKDIVNKQLRERNIWKFHSRATRRARDYTEFATRVRNPVRGKLPVPIRQWFSK